MSLTNLHINKIMETRSHFFELSLPSDSEAGTSMMDSMFTLKGGNRTGIDWDSLAGVERFKLVLTGTRLFYS